MDKKFLYYLIKRVLLAFLTVFLVITITFFFMHAIPGDPFMSEKEVPPQVKEALLEKYGLDKPLIVRFFIYLKNMLTGDLGVSYAINKNFAISDMIKGRLGISLTVGAMAMVFGTILGLILGILAFVPVMLQLYTLMVRDHAYYSDLALRNQIDCLWHNHPFCFFHNTLL